MQLLLGDGDSMNLERAHYNSELNKMTNWVYCPSSCMSLQVSAPSVFGYSGTGKQAWCMLTLHYTEPEVTFCWCNVVSYVCISWIIYGSYGVLWVEPINQLAQKPLTVVQWSPGHLPKPLVTFNPIIQHTTINGKATSGQHLWLCALVGTGIVATPALHYQGSHSLNLSAHKVTS